MADEKITDPLCTFAKVCNEPVWAHVGDLLDHNFGTKSNGMLSPVPPTADEKLPEQYDMLETAWGIIANAHEGDWSKATDEWVWAAEKWRDRFHALLDSAPPVAPSVPNIPEDVSVDAWREDAAKKALIDCGWHGTWWAEKTVTLLREAGVFDCASPAPSVGELKELLGE